MFRPNFISFMDKKKEKESEPDATTTATNHCGRTSFELNSCSNVNKVKIILSAFLFNFRVSCIYDLIFHLMLFP